MLKARGEKPDGEVGKISGKLGSSQDLPLLSHQSKTHYKNHTPPAGKNPEKRGTGPYDSTRLGSADVVARDRGRMAHAGTSVAIPRAKSS